MHEQLKQPVTLAGYLETMSKAVFQTGISWKVAYACLLMVTYSLIRIIQNFLTPVLKKKSSEALRLDFEAWQKREVK